MKLNSNRTPSPWIWLNSERYPEYQRTFPNIQAKKDDLNYCVAEFKKTVIAESTPVKADIRVSGDTFFRLLIGGQVIGVGPVCAGGDFLLAEPLSVHYANTYTIYPTGNTLEFLAQVQLTPVVLTDYSQGHGGFMLSCTLYFEDGSSQTVCTDESWLCRVSRKFTEPYTFDNTNAEDEWLPSSVTEDIWLLEDADIPMLWEKPIWPEASEILEFRAETETRTVFFDKIYSGYVNLEIEADGGCQIEVTCFELPGQGGTSEYIKTDKSLTYRSIQLHSIGGYELTVTSQGAHMVKIKPSLIFTCYPVDQEGSFTCSDPVLTKVYDVCKWTLRLCRQTIHLDSPRHQELLACTGDYYIESLMEAFCFGDMRLAELDILRTAKVLLQNNGRMFHTSYSLIWVQMLKDVYLFTGNLQMVESCMTALHQLLDRFQGYLGTNGLVDNAPDYMFVDWMVVDGYSLHHPPKALGQTCLNAFYYGALQTAAELCEIVSDSPHRQLYKERAEGLKAAHNAYLYDKERGLYVDGLNTETPESKWLPKNSLRRYFSKHGNTLSVLYGLCDAETGRRIMEQVVHNDALTDVQPYFMHFVLEALKKVNLFEKYGFLLLDRFKPVVEACDKGLQEGWHKPEETYSFDHSHAWGGTPAYQLPSQLLGFEMRKPGFREISLKPNLYCLDWAEITMPTPYGPIRCTLRKNEAPRMEIPEGITCIDK